MSLEKVEGMELLMDQYFQGYCEMCKCNVEEDK